MTFRGRPKMTMWPHRRRQSIYKGIKDAILRAPSRQAPHQRHRGSPIPVPRLPIGAMDDNLAARHRAIAAVRTAWKTTYALVQDSKT
jgi:hypothetical protein